MECFVSGSPRARYESYNLKKYYKANLEVQASSPAVLARVHRQGCAQFHLLCTHPWRDF